MVSKKNDDTLEYVVQLPLDSVFSAVKIPAFILLIYKGPPINCDIDGIEKIDASVQFVARKALKEDTKGAVK